MVVYHTREIPGVAGIEDGSQFLFEQCPAMDSCLDGYKREG